MYQRRHLVDRIVWPIVVLLLCAAAGWGSWRIWQKNLAVGACQDAGNVALVSEYWDDGGFYVVTCSPPTTTTIAPLPAAPGE